MKRDIEDIPVSDRGFFQHLRDFPTEYGNKVSVYESSSAEGPKVWLTLGGECHLEPPEQEPRWYSKPTMLAGKPYPGIRLVDGTMSAHMNLEQAIAVRDALTEWIDTVPERWGEPGAEYA